MQTLKIRCESARRYRVVAGLLGHYWRTTYLPNMRTTYRCRSLFRGQTNFERRGDTTRARMMSRVSRGGRRVRNVVARITRDEETSASSENLTTDIGSRIVRFHWRRRPRRRVRAQYETREHRSSYIIGGRIVRVTSPRARRRGHSYRPILFLVFLFARRRRYRRGKEFSDATRVSARGGHTSRAGFPREALQSATCKRAISPPRGKGAARRELRKGIVLYRKKELMRRKCFVGWGPDENSTPRNDTISVTAIERVSSYKNSIAGTETLRRRKFPYGQLFSVVSVGFLYGENISNRGSRDIVSRHRIFSSGPPGNKTNSVALTAFFPPCRFHGWDIHS